MVEKFTDYMKVFDIDYNKIIFEILSMPNVQQEIIEYNQEQLSTGRDGNDEKIITISAEEQNQGEVYSLFTIKERSSKGLQTRNVDLFDTGQFYNTFQVKVTKNSFEIIANYNKPDGNILDNFDDKFEFNKLTDDNLEGFVWQVFFPKFQKAVTESLRINSSRL